MQDQKSNWMRLFTNHQEMDQHCGKLVSRIAPLLNSTYPTHIRLSWTNCIAITQTSNVHIFPLYDSLIFFFSSLLAYIYLLNATTSFFIIRFRQYGLWDRYADLYPNQDLVYTVGVDDYSKNWFFAHVNRYVFLFLLPFPVFFLFLYLYLYQKIYTSIWKCQKVALFIYLYQNSPF